MLFYFIFFFFFVIIFSTGSYHRFHQKVGNHKSQTSRRKFRNSDSTESFLNQILINVKFLVNNNLYSLQNKKINQNVRKLSQISYCKTKNSKSRWREVESATVVKKEVYNI